MYIIEGKVREKKEEEVERILELEGSLMVQPEQVMKWGHVEREARGGGDGEDRARIEGRRRTSSEHRKENITQTRMGN